MSDENASKSRKKSSGAGNSATKSAHKGAGSVDSAGKASKTAKSGSGKRSGKSDNKPNDGKKSDGGKKKSGSGLNKEKRREKEKKPGMSPVAVVTGIMAIALTAFVIGSVIWVGIRFAGIGKNAAPTEVTEEVTTIAYIESQSMELSDLTSLPIGIRPDSDGYVLFTMNAKNLNGLSVELYVDGVSAGYFAKDIAQYDDDYVSYSINVKMPETTADKYVCYAKSGNMTSNSCIIYKYDSEYTDEEQALMDGLVEELKKVEDYYKGGNEYLPVDYFDEVLDAMEATAREYAAEKGIELAYLGSGGNLVNIKFASGLYYDYKIENPEYKYSISFN